MAEPAAKEARTEHRQRTLKGASILLGPAISEISCIIRNMHENGAELRVPADSRLPASFLLYVALDGIAYRCKVKWRREDRVGVEFDGTEPKPRWHYG